MNALPPHSQSILGSWRKFGEFGPVYQVTRLAQPRDNGEQKVQILVLESGEELDYPLADVLSDPIAD